jgi:hypothetical protein
MFLIEFCNLYDKIEVPSAFLPDSILPPTSQKANIIMKLLCNFPIEASHFHCI